MNALKDSRKYNSNPQLSDNTYAQTHKDFAPKTQMEIHDHQLSSIIRTLNESLTDPGHFWIACHDLVEAYNLLSQKMRIVVTSEQPVKISKTDSTLIMDCVAREIRQVLPNPFESQRSYFNSSSYSHSQLQDDYDLQEAIDESIVCQYALRVVSEIFTFPILRSNITDDQLTTLFHDVLLLCATTTYNAEKLCDMVLWILKVQRLPISVLASEKVLIVRALKAAISHPSGNRPGLLDALKTVHCTLDQYPAFSSWLIELLPSVLYHIYSGSLQVKFNAALALAGFAMSRMKFDLFPREKAIEFMDAYLDTEAAQSRPVSSESRLITCLKAAMHEGPQNRDTGLSFAMTIASCFIVLLDHAFFTKPRAVRVVVSVLEEAVHHKLSNLHQVHSEAWKMLFWSFSLMSPELENDGRKGSPSTRQRAYLLCCEDIRDLRGTFFVYTLLGTNPEAVKRRSAKDVSRAISIVAKMVHRNDSLSSSEGIHLLCRLLSTIGTPLTSDSQSQTFETKKPFSMELIDGSLLLQNSRKVSVSEVKVGLDQISPLTEEEVLEQWKDLSHIWITAVQRSINSSQDISPQLLSSWQALLLVRGELQPFSTSLSAPSTFAAEVISIITGLSPTLETNQRQSCYLTSLRRVWNVMKNVFSSQTWLASPAEQVLAFLLTKQFCLADFSVKEAWSHLCGDLLVVGIPTLIPKIQSRGDIQEKEVLKHLWLVTAEKRLQSPNEEESWEETVEFLTMPFGSWELSSGESEIWRDILQGAIKQAENQFLESYDVISFLLTQISEPKVASFGRSSSILNWLLSILSSHPCGQVHITLLSLIDDTLHSSYEHHDPGAVVETRAWAVDTLRLIGKVIYEAPSTRIVPLLQAVQSSLVCWLADEKGLLEDYEHEELVSILYTQSLKTLAHTEPSIITLQVLARFFKSVFKRSIEGPISFSNFWNATYHRRQDISPEVYPPEIKQCLKSLAYFLRNSYGDGFSIFSGSESMESYTIPDSQNPHHGDDNEDGNETILFDLVTPLDRGLPVHVAAHDFSKSSEFSETTTPTLNPHIRQEDEGGSIGGNVQRQSPPKRPPEDEAVSPNASKKSRSTSYSRTSRSGICLTRTSHKGKLRQSPSHTPSPEKSPLQSPCVSLTSSQAFFMDGEMDEPGSAHTSKNKNNDSMIPWLRSNFSDPRIPGVEDDNDDILPNYHKPPGISPVPRPSGSNPEAGLSPEIRLELRPSGGSLEDDYDTWEQGFIDPDSEENGVGVKDEAEDDKGASDADNSDLLSPSLGDFLFRARRQLQ